MDLLSFHKGASAVPVSRKLIAHFATIKFDGKNVWTKDSPEERRFFYTFHSSVCIKGNERILREINSQRKIMAVIV